MQSAPQDNQLMSKHRVLSLEPHLRLEWRGHGGQDETESPIIRQFKAISSRINSDRVFSYTQVAKTGLRSAYALRAAFGFPTRGANFPPIDLPSFLDRSSQTCVATSERQIAVAPLRPDRRPVVESDDGSSQVLAQPFNFRRRSTSRKSQSAVSPRQT